MGFFMLSFTFEGIAYRIPFSPRVVMVMQGSITLNGGLVIFYYAKPKRIDYLEKTVPPNVEKQEILFRQDDSDQTEQVDAINMVLTETEKEAA